MLIRHFWWVYWKTVGLIANSSKWRIRVSFILIWGLFCNYVCITICGRITNYINKVFFFKFKFWFWMNCAAFLGLHIPPLLDWLCTAFWTTRNIKVFVLCKIYFKIETPDAHQLFLVKWIFSFTYNGSETCILHCISYLFSSSFFASIGFYTSFDMDCHAP